MEVHEASAQCWDASRQDAGGNRCARQACRQMHRR